MTPEPPVDPEAVDPEALVDPAPPEEPEAAGTPARLIDVSAALHSAGHEVADLGFEDLPDSGPVLHPEHGHSGPDDPLDFVNVQMPSD